jgi:hypothetical protein
MFDCTFKGGASSWQSIVLAVTSFSLGIVNLKGERHMINMLIDVVNFFKGH